MQSMSCTTSAVDAAPVARDDAFQGPWVDSPVFNRLIDARPLSATEKELIRKYREDGYLVITESIVDETHARMIQEHVWDKIEDGRYQDAWRVCEAVKDVAAHEKVLSILRLLYGREPIPFQTLNFVRGTEQATHSDVIHFSSLPRGFMAAAWVALEDITLKQGPLHYFPGSHKLPEFDYYDMGIAEEYVYPDAPWEGPNSWDNPRTMHKYKLYEQSIKSIAQENGFERHKLTLKKGEFLLWSANLLHGGEAIIDSLSTRKSQVTHYHFENVVPWAPMFSNAKAGEYHVPPLNDIRTGEPLKKNLFNDKFVKLTPMGRQHRYRIEFPNQADAAANAESNTFYEEMARLQDELRYYRDENARLQEQIKAMTDTKIWKMSSAIRQAFNK
ncbi:MAG: phytanoyl-CoA dioxygenase family protein [Candidatus Obscuribacterales bacterium]